MTIKEFLESTKELCEDKLVEYWKNVSSMWPVSEKLKFVLELAEGNVWYWGAIFDDFLCSVEPGEGYPLLHKIINKGGIGLMLPKFKDRCQKDISFAREYVRLLDQTRTYDAAKFSGLLLALLFKRIKELTEIECRLLSMDKYNQISGAFAIRILDAEKQTSNISPSLLNLIFKHIAENGINEVKHELIPFFISNFNLANEQQQSDCLTAIFNDSRILIVALQALSNQNTVPKNIRFKILEKTIEDKDEQDRQIEFLIEHWIGNCLAVWGIDDVKRSLEIVRSIALRKSSYHIPENLIWAVEKIGELKIEESLDVLESWLCEDMSESERILRNQFLYPDFLIHLTKTRKDKLVERLKKLTNHEKNDLLVISVIQEYMKLVNITRDWNPVDPQDDLYLQSCIGCLKMIALRKGKDTSRFPSDNESKIIQCGKLIELIEEVEYMPDTELLKNSLERYTNINRFINVSVNKVELQSPSPKPFFRLLGSNRCTYQQYLDRVSKAKSTLTGGKLITEFLRTEGALYRESLLTHLDNCLAAIHETERGTSALRDKLLHGDEDQFQSALSEIEVIGRLRACPQLEVKISELSEVTTNKGIVPKRPDISVQFGNESLKVEIITPQMAAVLRFLGGGSIPNRLTPRIISEFHKHFKGQAEDQDAIIIVDVTNTEIDYFEAISSMQGTPSIRFLINRSTGRVIDEYPIHASDSITDREPETKAILGILIYKKRMGKEGHLLLVGKFFENIRSRSLHKLNICKLIEEQLLDFVE